SPAGRRVFTLRWKALRGPASSSRAARRAAREKGLCPVRILFHEELDFISDQLVQMSQLAAQALERATRSLLEADLTLAEQVITDDDEIDALRRDLENR